MTSFLIFISFFIVTSTIAITQQIILRTWEGPNNNEFTDNRVELVFLNDSNVDQGFVPILKRAQYFIVNGWWRFYTDVDWKLLTETLDDHGYDFIYDAVTNESLIDMIGKELKSVRHLGPCDTDTTSVSFYQKDYEQEGAFTVTGQNDLPTDFEDSQSLFFTGRATWRFWSDVDNTGTQANVTITSRILRLPTRASWPANLRQLGKILSVQRIA